MEEAVASKEEQENIVLKKLTPLLNSMKLFGVYFTRKHRVTPEIAAEVNDRGRRCAGWNFARVYSTILFVVTWFSALEFVINFDGRETIGGELFTKLASIPSGLMNIIFHTSYYVASHTGRLDRVLRDASSYLDDHRLKYDRLTKIVTVVGWVLMAWIVFHFVYQLFISQRSHDLTIIFFSRILSETTLYVIKTVLVVFHLPIIGVWIFPQAIK